jgi:hypothetical protein
MVRAAVLRRALGLGLAVQQVRAVVRITLKPATNPAIKEAAGGPAARMAGARAIRGALAILSHQND